MPSRQFHHKSRHGCANCKQRKIRCGEERPSCANCNRLGGRCSFLESDASGGPLFHSSPGSSGSTPQASAAGTHSPHERTEDLEQYDDALIKRWSEATCFTMSDRWETFRVWQVSVPALASDQPFLRHGLLALASMHVRYTSPPLLQSRYLDLATQHQARALAGYIPELRTITPGNCHALFAFSALLLPIRYSFISAMDGEIDPEDVLGEITSVFDYVIGATVIASRGAGWLRAGVLRPLMDRTTDPGDMLLYLVKEPQDALRSLMAYVEHLAREAEANNNSEILAKIPIYVRSIGMLTNAFPSEDAERRIFDDMIGWPHFVGGDLVRLLRERDQMALVVLAHYGVALHAFNGFWWLDKVGARLIQAISRMLRPEFLALVQWPLNRIAVEQASQHMYIM
ncbi:hypothetical protein G647_05084 [Cladophialophora carrionii CBS 160.54]|uniref:Zn(2)-C6 fungal-type domain-containing protein n=1 Tax=Cladophialophora carrionii CBS 160.54 TaxID=1279043 RepID=V9D8N5_9EURO|nr:uncharacterized protein G647_05084 [Cladophialophora carrionii CBS 160.54]ETI23284.1 hypothetical protein G647_05084 [Cladophialophora carrionii CBS 160.54]